METEERKCQESRNGREKSGRGRGEMPQKWRKKGNVRRVEAEVETPQKSGVERKCQKGGSKGLARKCQKGGSTGVAERTCHRVEERKRRKSGRKERNEKSRHATE